MFMTTLYLKEIRVELQRFLKTEKMTGLEKRIDETPMKMLCNKQIVYHQLSMILKFWCPLYKCIEDVLAGCGVK